MRKRNRALIIITIAFFAVAIAALIIGYWLSGADIAAWFSSKWAMMCYIVLGTYALIVGMYLITGWIRKL